MTISYQTIRDLIAVGIYVVFLGVQIVSLGLVAEPGQARPRRPRPWSSTSEYGRPLVRKG